MKKFYFGLVGIIILLMVATLYAADDVKVKLNTTDGSSTFAVQNSTPVTVATVDSQGAVISGNTGQPGKIVLWDGSANTISVTSPPVASDYTLTLPTTAGTSNQFLRTDGVGTLAWASPYTLVATLAGDQATAADVNPVTLTGLVFTYEVNSVYRIWFMGRVSPAASTTGCGFQLDLSSAVTDINVIFCHQLANTGTLSGGHSIADDASVGVSSGMPGTSTYSVIGNGILRTTSNTGTAQLRFRSETTAVTTAKAGFTLVVEKIQ